MKPKPTFSEQYREWISALPKEERQHFCRDGQQVFCKICSRMFKWTRKFQIEQHICTTLHKSAVSRHVGLQSLVTQDSPRNLFNDELCKAFISADIPWKKLENPVLKSFLEKYCKQTIPSEWTLRNTCLQKTYNEVIDAIRKDIGDHPIWLGVDETTDKCGRYVANVVIGSLNGEPSLPHLLVSKELEATNNSTVSQLVRDSLRLLWPEKSEGEINKKFKMLVSDGVPYMIKAGKNLKKDYPGLLHITCLAHGLNRVAETIRAHFSNVDKLIASVKAVFKKAPSRVRKYKELFPNLPLPPEPCLTRWGTWLEAAKFHAEHFDDVKLVIDELDSADAESIRKAQRLLGKPEIKLELADLAANFCFLAPTITKLEERNLQLASVVDELAGVALKFENLQSRTGKLALDKLKCVLAKNPDYDTVTQIADVLKGNHQTKLNMDPAVIAAMKYCPLTSVDLERSFSIEKAMLADRRRGFTMKNLEMSVVCHYELCNKI